MQGDLQTPSRLLSQTTFTMTSGASEPSQTLCRFRECRWLQMTMQKRLPCPTLLNRRAARGASSGAGQPWAWASSGPLSGPCWLPLALLIYKGSSSVSSFPEHMCVHVYLGDICRVPRIRNRGLCLVLSNVRSVPLRSLHLGSALVLLYPGLPPPERPRLPTPPSPRRLCRREIPRRPDC